MASKESRPSSRPPFWDERYAAHDHLFGRAPSAFVADEAARLPPESEVVEFGAGEGRTLRWLAQECGHRCTAVDFSAEALSQAEAWARQHDLPLETIQADVRTWTPSRQWDVALLTFLQLLPDERPGLYERLRAAVQPGGWILAEWFRPAHVEQERFDRIGPSRRDRMVPPDEVCAAFAGDTILRCDPVETTLNEGEFLNGRAAVVRLVVRRDGREKTQKLGGRPEEG